MTPEQRVIDHLIQLAEGLDLGEVQVVDGQPGTHVPPDVIVIGFSPDRLAVEATTEDGGLNRERKRFGIVCLASASSGGPSAFKPLRDRAYSFYEAIAAGVKADQNLDGAVSKAQCQTTAYAQEHIHNTDTNSVTTAATVEFVVNCIVF